MVEDEIRKALDAFYDALNKMLNGDVDPMCELWSHADDVTYMGPLGDMQVGWQQVEDSWRHQTRMRMGGEVLPQEVSIVVAGEMGYAICIERGEDLRPDGEPVLIDHRATNVWRREDGEWKMVHHHADIAHGLQQGT